MTTKFGSGGARRCAALVAALPLVAGCLRVALNTPALALTLTQLPLRDGVADIRPVFSADDTTTNATYFLYHLRDVLSGRWVLSTRVDSADEADVLLSVASWAVVPYAIDDLADNAALSAPLTAPVTYQDVLQLPGKWLKIPASLDKEVENPEIQVAAWSWQRAPQMHCDCVDGDDSVFFDSSASFAPELSGFYLLRYVVDPDDSAQMRPVHLRVKATTADRDLFLFPLPPANGERVWVIGDRVFVDQAFALCRLPSLGADDELTLAPLTQCSWRFVVNATWQVDVTAQLYTSTSHYLHTQHHVQKASDPNLAADPDQIASVPNLDHHHILLQSFRRSIYESLRYHRSVLATPQPFLRLRHGVAIPQLGLGTGGLDLAALPTLFRQALRIGYRMFDLAREYGNEALIGEILASLAPTEEESRLSRKSSLIVRRQEVFLISKVWPTELGFGPTTEAVMQSVRALRTNYIDLYFLHWPSCDASVEWMHCHTTVDAGATWHASYHALQKLHAEGVLSSVGVSNFPLPLLQEIQTSYASLPHVVQNFANLAYLDLEVRNFCQQHHILYMPYASMRHYAQLPAERLAAAQALAAARQQDVYSLILKFFLQTQALMIPRTQQLRHLTANFQVLQAAELSAQQMRELGWDAASDDHEDL